MRRDVFVWHGEMLKGRARGSPRKIRGRMSEVGGPCGVESMEMRARELSVLDCLVNGLQSELGTCRASAPACRVGRQECLAYNAPARSHRRLKPSLKDVLNEDPNGIPAGNP